MGFAAGDVDRIGTLVRHHLLLGSLATSRDPDDPATVAALTARVDDPETLALLAALTEADARATAPQAWTTWRATLTKALVSAAAGALVSSGHRPTAPSQAPVPIPAEVEADPSAVSIAVTPTADGSRVTVVSGDRVGLLADIAATLSLQRTPVRGARAWNQGRFGLSRWDVSDGHLDAAVLRQRYDALRAGRVVARDRLRAAAGGGLAPTVVVHADASADATVLEVRAHDRAGVLFLALDALAGLGVTVRSAHVDTLGPQAVDVFYLQEESAGSLSEDRAAEAAHAVRSALGG
jgi:[protein-PII] uridylyltransferase